MDYRPPHLIPLTSTQTYASTVDFAQGELARSQHNTRAYTFAFAHAHGRDLTQTSTNDALPPLLLNRNRKCADSHTSALLPTTTPTKNEKCAD